MTDVTEEWLEFRNGSFEIKTEKFKSQKKTIEKTKLNLRYQLNLIRNTYMYVFLNKINFFVSDWKYTL